MPETTQYSATAPVPIDTLIAFKLDQSARHHRWMLIALALGCSAALLPPVFFVSARYTQRIARDAAREDISEILAHTQSALANVQIDMEKSRSDTSDLRSRLSELSKRTEIVSYEYREAQEVLHQLRQQILSIEQRLAKVAEQTDQQPERSPAKEQP